MWPDAARRERFMSQSARIPVPVTGMRERREEAEDSIVKIVFCPLILRHLVTDLVLQVTHIDVLRAGNAGVGKVIPIALAAEYGAGGLEAVIAWDRVLECVRDDLVRPEAGAVLVDAAHGFGIAALLEAGGRIQLFELLLDGGIDSKGGRGCKGCSDINRTRRFGITEKPLLLCIHHNAAGSLPEA